MDPIIWAVALLALAVILGVFELFIPSGGVLAFLAITSMVSSVVVAFYQGPVPGIIFFFIVVIGAPLFFWSAITLWPKTPIGRRIMLAEVKPEQVLPENQNFKQLVGQQGITKTKMLPAGAVEIAGQTYTACSEGMAIAPGTPIEVIDVHGVEIIVRPVYDESPEKTPQAESDADSDDILSKPADTLGFEEDPFA